MFRSNEVPTAVGNIRTVRAYLDDKKIELLKRAREGEKSWPDTGSGVGIPRQAALGTLARARPGTFNVRMQSVGGAEREPGNPSPERRPRAHIGTSELAGRVSVRQAQN